jgi:hypothetical protein
MEADEIYDAISQMFLYYLRAPVEFYPLSIMKSVRVLR